MEGVKGRTKQDSKNEKVSKSRANKCQQSSHVCPENEVKGCALQSQC